jgi:shikimate kinase
MMGAGKSALGRRLAQKLDVPFRDADAEIELAAGCSVSEIFSRFGEEAFRDGERRVITRLLDEEPHILATGGGAFIDEGTRARIRERAVCILLNAPIELLLARTKRRDTRPLLREGDPKETLERLLAVREPIYAQADLTVDSAEGPHNQSVDKIINALRGAGILAS